MILRKLSTHREYLQAEDVQRKVWGYPEREVIPLNELVVVQKNGGHVFGAFEGARMIAFCWGLPGYDGKRVYHCSRMLGVLPGRRDAGLGRALKLKQRDFALAQGLDLIRWTFDPLQSRNAYFNIEKLGCVVREYTVNLYGTSGSRFNVGWATDRVGPEWWIRSQRVRERLAGRRRPPSIDDALALPSAARGRGREKRVTIEIPHDIEAVKRESLKRARAWRLRVRGLFLDAFKRGYAATGFATGGDRRSLYILERGFRLR